jgi:hypothetical protein
MKYILRCTYGFALHAYDQASAPCSLLLDQGYTVNTKYRLVVVVAIVVQLLSMHSHMLTKWVPHLLIHTRRGFHDFGNSSYDILNMWL